MPRFVVLEHSWNGIHWDLMLERGATLRTWSLAERPGTGDASIEARALADHRIAYLDYEGPISGARGSVQRVDAGGYEVIAEHPNRLVLEFRGKVLRGIGCLDLVSDRDVRDQNVWRFRLGNAD